MTIYCYEGLPGSGKSYDAARKIISQLLKGRRVVTNIDGMQQEYQQNAIKHYFDIDDFDLDDTLKYIDSEQVPEFWEHSSPGDLIVIDEAQNFFNSRDWQSKNNRALGKWASEHRKRGNDLILITQAMEGIESSVRRLVEWCYRYKKLNMFGGAIQKKYIRFAYYGQTLDPLGKKVCTYDPKIFKCYSSYFAEDVQESGAETPPNVFKHPVFFAVPILLIAFFYFASKSSLATGDLFGSEAAMKNAQAKIYEAAEGKTHGKRSESKPNPVSYRSSEPDHTVLGVVNGKIIIQKTDGSIVTR